MKSVKKVDMTGIIKKLSIKVVILLCAIITRLFNGFLFLLKYLKGQILFLSKFEYSAKNLKKHLELKASSFFGIEMKQKRYSNVARNKYKFHTSNKKEILKKTF